jgi:hypothetical protein
MPHFVKRAAVPLVIALTLLTAPALAGCSVQNLIHDVSGGTVDVPGKSIPKDFPGEVPLVSGEVLSGAAVGDAKARIWNVSIRASGFRAMDEVASALTTAGFTAKTLTAATEEGGALVADKGDLNVAVVEVKDSAGYVLNYTVTRGTGK